MASLPTVRLRHLALVPAAVGAVLGAELMWVVRRDLPSYEGFDISGVRSGPAGRPGAPLRIVALGDSTLTGPGLARADDVWLWQALDALEVPRGVDVRSLAVGGSRAADVRRRVGAALALRADVIVVAVGSNDAIHGTARHRFARELGSLIDELASAGAVLAVANVGDLGNLERVPAPLAWALTARSHAIRAEIEALVAERADVHLLDVSTSDPGFEAGGLFVGDRFHPDANGHRLWADAAMPGLRDAIEAAEAAALDA